MPELTDPAKRLEELANEGGVTFTPAELRYLATAFQHETEALEAYRKERDWLEDKLRPSDDRVRELEEALRSAVRLIESVNGCHGCLDNGGQESRDEFARLVALSTKTEATNA